MPDPVPQKPFWKDLQERSIRTFTQSVVSSLVAAGTGFIDVAAWKLVVVSAGAATLATVQSFLRERWGNQ